MPPTREELIKELTDAGLVSSEEVTKIESVTGATGVQAILDQLIESGKITPYQADKFGQGQGAEIAFGDYVVLDELGRGGMGTVLRARHRRMDREVAIKVLPVAALDSEVSVARFYQEVKVAAQLTHPNIVHAYDAGEHHGFHYLVMEYVRGRDLGKVIQTQGAVPLAQAIDFVIQAAEGLQYAHSKGVVHRDVKPSNLLLDENDVVKILDMGLARIGKGLGDASQSMHLTTTGQVMGTVDYMAPEQAEDTRNATHQSDIYSLGCTLFRLVTGVAPYSKDTVVKSILAHREAAIPNIGSGPNYERLNQIFRKMVAKRPEDRFGSCQELVLELQSAAKIASATQSEKTVQFGQSPAPPTQPIPPVAGSMGGVIAGPGSSVNDLHETSSLLKEIPVEQPEVVDDEPTSPSSTSHASELQPFKESTLLPDPSQSHFNLSVVSLVLSFCCGIGGVIGAIGLVMTYMDLKKIDAGKMDGVNRDRVKMSMIVCCIAVGIMVLYILTGVIRDVF